MPVWHQRTEQWVKEGKLVLLGITQEQHPERCRLFAQWQGFEWPILHDPINVMRAAAVPIVVAIDEHGIVRSTDPDLETFEEEFLNKTFPPPTSVEELASRSGETTEPDVAELERRAVESNTAEAWRLLGDALVLWHSGDRLEDAISAYTRAKLLKPDDGATLFRLGVGYRMRYDSELRRPGDFGLAIQHWTAALDIDPNQYIWRRRIQQYGPRLTKPYPFYDWVEQAAREITARGEQPIELRVPLVGAEIADPSEEFSASASGDEISPDPQGRINRDVAGLIAADVTVVPPAIKPGGTARVHITMRPAAGGAAHWNNENEPLRLWVEPRQGWEIERRLLTAPQGDRPETTEARRFEFEVRAPADAREGLELGGYALYYVCEEAGGTCLFLRKDIPVVVPIAN